MTRFITFRDVVLNTDEIQYVMIVPTDHEMRKGLNWKEADWAVKAVIGKESDSTYFAYATKDHAKEAVAMIYNLLNPPAVFTESLDPNEYPLTSTPSTTIGQP